MNAQDLKNSILQLAIQGKLVEQREEEGTAKELLEKIEAEKKKLIKESKIKKQKALPTIKEDEIPFDIPESWEWVRLGEIGEIVGGGTPKTGNSEFWNGGDIPWLTPADMKFVPGKYVKNGERFITEKGLKGSSARLMPKGTIIYSSRAPIGYIAIAENDLATNQGFKSLVPYVVSINEYMYYCLISRTNEIISRASGTTFKEISGSEFGLTVVPLPPLEEQKRIVAKIEELKPYVDKYDVAYSEVVELNKKFPEDMQKSILQYAIQGNLVEQREEEGNAEELYQQIQEEKEKLIKEGKIKKAKKLSEITEDEIPFDIPKSWKWVRLGSLTEIITKGSSPSWQGIKYTDEGLLFVTSENVGVEQLLLDTPKYLEERFNEIQERSILKKGDILTNIVGASIGRTAIYDRDGLANINQAVCLIRLINKSLNGYITKYLNSYVAYKIMMNDKVDTARANISLTNISDFIVPLPPLEEQKRIVARIEELLPYTKKLM